MGTIDLNVISRPLPVPDADTAPFWEACQERRLVVQRCTSCGKTRFPPIGICHHCRSWEFTWSEITRGTVYSWVVIEHGVIESLRRQLPYIVALIDLGDGIHMPSDLIGVEPDDVQAGMPVRVDFQEIEGGFMLPMFRPET